MTSPKKEMFRTIEAEKGVNTSEEVVSLLRDTIHSGELSAGDRLLPERDLEAARNAMRDHLFETQKAQRLEVEGNFPNDNGRSRKKKS